MIFLLTLIFTIIINSVSLYTREKQTLIINKYQEQKKKKNSNTKKILKIDFIYKISRIFYPHKNILKVLYTLKILIHYYFFCF